MLKREQALPGVGCGPAAGERSKSGKLSDSVENLKAVNPRRALPFRDVLGENTARQTPSEKFLNCRRSNFIGKRWQHPGFA